MCGSKKHSIKLSFQARCPLRRQLYSCCFQLQLFIRLNHKKMIGTPSRRGLSRQTETASLPKRKVSVRKKTEFRALSPEVSRARVFPFPLPLQRAIMEKEEWLKGERGNRLLKMQMKRTKRRKRSWRSVQTQRRNSARWWVLLPASKGVTGKSKNY